MTGPPFPSTYPAPGLFSLSPTICLYLLPWFFVWCPVFFVTLSLSFCILCPSHTFSPSNSTFLPFLYPLVPSEDFDVAFFGPAGSRQPTQGAGHAYILVDRFGVLHYTVHVTGLTSWVRNVMLIYKDEPVAQLAAAFRGNYVCLFFPLEVCARVCSPVSIAPTFRFEWY